MNNAITFVWEAQRGGGDVGGYVLELDDGSAGQFRVSLRVKVSILFNFNAIAAFSDAWSGVVISRWSRSTKFTHVGPGEYLLGWVTVSGFSSRCGTFISVCNHPPRSTQSGYPFMGRRSEYQPNGGDALRLDSKGSGWQVKLCDPLVTHGPLSERFREVAL